MHSHSSIQYQIESDRVIAIDNENNIIGEIDFPLKKEGTVIMNHTFVDPAYRGQQIAETLFNLAIDEVQKRQLTVIPTCSYAVLQFQRHPELSFLLD